MLLIKIFILKTYDYNTEYINLDLSMFLDMLLYTKPYLKYFEIPNSMLRGFCTLKCPNSIFLTSKYFYNLN